MQEIRITCKSADTLPIDRILEFQGKLKKLSKGNQEKLKNSILKHGFCAPLFVWDDQGEWKLLDGHQRLATLISMRQEGYNIPMLPVDYIEAADEAEAKEKLLNITSQYGEFDMDGLTDFIQDIDINFDEIRLTNDEYKPFEEIEIDEPEEEPTQEQDDSCYKMTVNIPNEYANIVKKYEKQAEKTEISNYIIDLAVSEVGEE